MKQKIQLQVPAPCHENWNSMSATQQGRFCLSCQKEVVDFSVMTDKEILAHISTASSSMCGRFGNDQLNRDLILPAEPRKTWWKYGMGIAASFMLLTAKSNAQVKFSRDSIVLTPLKLLPDSERLVSIVVGGVSAVRTIDHSKRFSLKGLITDESGKPIAGATVIIKNTRSGTIADENGRFMISIKSAGTAVLSVSSIGYETQEVKVESRQADQPDIKLVMKIYTTMGLMGEILVTKKRRNPLVGIFKPNTVKCINPLQESAVQVFPNPVIAGGSVNVKMNAVPAGNYRMRVYDISGNMMINKEIMIGSKEAVISLQCDQRFTGGTYLLHLTGNGKNISSKFIVL